MKDLTERVLGKRVRIARSAKHRPPSVLPAPVNTDGVPSRPSVPSPISTGFAAPVPFARPANIVGPPPQISPENPGVPASNHVRSSSFPHFPPVALPDDQPDASRIDVQSPVAEPERHETILLGGDSVVQLKELVELRGKDITRRVNLKNGIRDIEYQWQHASKAQETFMRACATMMLAFSSRTMDPLEQQQLQDNWRELQNMSGHVKSREIGLESALQDLFQLENKLFLKEEKFYGRLQGISGAKTFSDSDEDEYFEETNHFTALSAPSSSSSDTTHSVAHQYYSRVGDINLLRERIFNFESEHRRQKAIRDGQRSAGYRVQPSDKVFYRNFLDEKQAMVQEYIEAKQAMERLMDSCALQGVDVEPPNLPPFLDHSFRVERSPREYSGNGDEEDLKPSPFARLHRVSTRLDRIACWVRSMQKSKPLELAKKDTWDSLSRTTVPHTLGGTDQQAEDYLAFPLYNHLKPPTFEVKTPPKKDEGQNLRKRGPEMFEVEMLQRRCLPTSGKDLEDMRRYSAPALETFRLHIPLEDGNLDFLNEDIPDLSSRSYTQDLCSMSDLETVRQF
jgi:hypothetical protein